MLPIAQLRFTDDMPALNVRSGTGLQLGWLSTSGSSSCDGDVQRAIINLQNEMNFGHTAPALKPAPTYNCFLGNSIATLPYYTGVIAQSRMQPAVHTTIALKAHAQTANGKSRHAPWYVHDA